VFDLILIKSIFLYFLASNIESLSKPAPVNWDKQKCNSLMY